MCNKFLSNTTTASFITDILCRHGVKHACISPGSRNTPLTSKLVTEKKIHCYSHIDERSSAYFGLGIAKTTNRPVAVLTTSGTATANLFPAVIEASLSKIPLVLITADRPKRLINTGESQTIEQINLFGKHTRDFIDIDPQNKSVKKQLNQLESLMMQCKGFNKSIPGPIHINVRFEEPLLDNNDALNYKIKIKKNKLEKESIELPKFKNALIVSGPCNNQTEINHIISFSKKINAPIFADILSQLRFNSNNKNINTYYDHYIDHMEIKPDLVIRFGDKPISKKLTNFLNKHKKITYLIDEYAGFNDNCGNLINNELGNLTLKNLTKGDSQYIDYINNLEIKTKKIISDKINKSRSQARLVKNMLNYFNSNDFIFIGSSTILRTFDGFSSKLNKPLNIFSNYISRGIDGIISTSLGMAATNNKTKNYLFIGDISFFYDINAFHILKDQMIDLTIIVVNNNGGQIFTRLPYSKNNIKDFEKFWITPLKTSIKNVSKLFTLSYFKANLNSIDKIQNISSKKGVNIIEFSISNKSEIKFLEQISKQISNKLI